MTYVGKPLLTEGPGRGARGCTLGALGGRARRSALRAHGGRARGAGALGKGRSSTQKGGTGEDLGVHFEWCLWRNFEVCVVCFALKKRVTVVRERGCCAGMEKSHLARPASSFCPCGIVDLGGRSDVVLRA